jgi:hypothetical protein
MGVEGEAQNAFLEHKCRMLMARDTCHFLRALQRRRRSLRDPKAFDYFSGGNVVLCVFLGLEILTCRQYCLLFASRPIVAVCF